MKTWGRSRQSYYYHLTTIGALRVPCWLFSMALHALVSRLKVVWAMAELSALARLMRTRKHDGLRSRDRMFALACLVGATNWALPDSEPAPYNDPNQFWRDYFLVEDVFRGVGTVLPCLCPTKSSRRLVSLHCVACLSTSWGQLWRPRSGRGKESGRSDPGPQPAGCTGHSQALHV